MRPFVRYMTIYNLVGAGCVVVWNAPWLLKLAGVVLSSAGCWLLYDDVMDAHSFRTANRRNDA